MLFSTLWFNFNFNNLFETSELTFNLDLLFFNEDAAVCSSSTSFFNLYHFSIPSTKIFYPEPFIATPTFIHYDIWFIHISIYQYWLWFFFIFIIVFFILFYVHTVRWCNPSVAPQRETRGVSRSKCGDFITAVVPVTWAGSILVHESTDAIDYYDGFGTVEMAIGIRAYQWGWEYYYPKDLDLYRSRNSDYTLNVGKSLVYSSHNNNQNFRSTFWNFFKKKDIMGSSLLPLTVLLSGNLKADFLGLWHYKNFGLTKRLIRHAFRSSLNSNYLTFDHRLNRNLVDNTSTRNFINLNNKFLLEKSVSHSPILSKKEYTYLSPNSVFNFSVNFSNIKNLRLFFKKSTPVDSLTVSEAPNPQSNFSSEVTSYVSYTENVQADFTSIYNQNSSLNNTKNKFLNEFFFQLRLSKIYASMAYTSSDSASSKLPTADTILFVESYLKSKIDFKSKQSFGIFDKCYRSRTYLSVVDSFNSGFFLRKRELESFKSTNVVESNVSDQEFKFCKVGFYSGLSLFQGSVESSRTKNLFFPNASGLLSNLDSGVNLKKDLYLGFDPLYFLNNSLGSFNKVSGFFWPQSYLYDDFDFKRWIQQEMSEDLYYKYVVGSDAISFYEQNSSLGSWSNAPELLIASADTRISESDELTLSTAPGTAETYNSNNLPAFLANSNTLNFNFVDRQSTLVLFNYQQFYEVLDGSLLSSKYSDYTFDGSKLNFISTTFNFLVPVLELDSLNLVLNDSGYLTLKPSVFSLNDSEFSEDLQLLPSDVMVQAVVLASLLGESSVVGTFSGSKALTNPYGVRFVLSILNNSTHTNHKLSVDLPNEKLQSYTTLNANFKSFWKVYKSAFEGRKSVINWNYFSATSSKLPLITETLFNFKTFVSKTNTALTTSNLFIEDFLIDLSATELLKNNYINYFSFDFPFSVGVEAERSKYSWFDWFSRLTYRPVKYLEVGSYNLNGLKAYQNRFDFSVDDNVAVNGLDNLMTKIVAARKHYKDNWNSTGLVAHSYTSNVFHFNRGLGNLFAELVRLNTDDLSSFLFLECLFSDRFVKPSGSSLDLTGASSLLTPTKSFWLLLNKSNSFYFFYTLLVDILEKREMLIKRLVRGISTNSLVYIPTLFKASTQNPFVIDLQTASLNSAQPALNSQTKSDAELLFKFYLKNKRFPNFFKYRAFLASTLTNNVNHPKSQYIASKKTPFNMIKIQPTSAIAMPIETRLQILAFSKDIIHSWSVPSAGVKIDCIPGFSSHRILIFFLSGIYWGQCMEICGRFHHWMPIIVYFMRRDLFIIWCSHFILNNKNKHADSESMFKDYTDTSALVSVPKHNWVYEL